MNLWEKIKKIFFNKKKNFIPIIIFILIIMSGVVAKSFLFYKSYFWYLSFVFILIIFVFIYNLKKNKEFNNYVGDSTEEYQLLMDEIKDKKKDYFYINKIIEVFSVLLIVIFILYFFYIRYWDILNF